MQIWSIWLMKQVNTILPDEEELPGIGEGIKLGTIVGDNVGVERSRNGVVTTGEPENSTCVGVARGTGGFCQT